MKQILFILIIISTSFTSFAQKAKGYLPPKNYTLITSYYTCSMHNEIMSDTTGTCRKCGMDLLLSKKEQMKAGMMKLYSCPMHPEVFSDAASKCRKCGMDLTLSEKEVAAEAYTCPMHPEVVSGKAGNCPKCSSKLVADRRGSKQGVVVYTCSMHPGVTSDKPGKCSQCGMDLAEKKQ